jgi:hypothetical protein
MEYRRMYSRNKFHPTGNGAYFLWQSYLPSY